jgi:hypothetical protein
VCSSWMRIAHSSAYWNIYVNRRDTNKPNMFSDFELYGQSCLSDWSDFKPRNLPAIPDTAEHCKRFKQEVLAREQTAETLTQENADEFLALTAEAKPGYEISHEFITNPSQFAADQLLADNGEKLLKKVSFLSTNIIQSDY